MLTCEMDIYDYIDNMTDDYMSDYFDNMGDLDDLDDPDDPDDLK